MFAAAAFEDWTAYFPLADVMYRECSLSFQPAVPIIVNQAWKSIIIQGVSKTVDKSVILYDFILLVNLYLVYAQKSNFNKEDLS